MPIVSSVIQKTVVQVDGRTDVTEAHTDQNGIVYLVNYLAPIGLDLNATLTTRAAAIGKDIDGKAAVIAAAQGYEIPLSQTQFLSKFTLAERIAIRDAGATNKNITDFLDYLSKTPTVYRKAPLGQTTIDGLNYLTSLGLLAAGRSTTILTA